MGLVNMESSFDPKPSLRIENGVVKEMDGRDEKTLILSTISSSAMP